MPYYADPAESACGARVPVKQISEQLADPRSSFAGSAEDGENLSRRFCDQEDGPLGPPQKRFSRSALHSSPLGAYSPYSGMNCGLTFVTSFGLPLKIT